MSEDRQRQLLAVDRGLAVLVGFAACVVAARAWALTVDDAFIVARYAEHAADHGELAFNLGEPPVEGVTSPAFLGIAWLAALLGLSPVVAMKACGGLGLVAAIAAMIAVAEELDLAPPARTFAAVYATAPEVATFATAGLETAAFIAASCGVILALARASRDPSQGRWLAAAAALATAIRPEGLVVGGVALAFWALPRLRHHPRRTVGALLWLLVPLALLVGARAALFGTLVPNTYYAKLGAWSRVYADGLAWVAGLVLVDVVVVATGIVAVAHALGVERRTPGDGRTRRAMVSSGAATLAAVIIAVAYSRHALVMNYAHRFQHHVLPLLWIAALPLIGAAGRAAASLGAHRRRHGVWAASLALVAGLSGCTRRLPVLESEAGYRAYYQRVADEMSHGAAAWVQEHLSEDALIACYPDAGLVPYVTDRPTIDFGRLNDATLAREPERTIDYFFERSPEALIVWSRQHGVLYDTEAERLVDDPRFTDAYERETLIGDEDIGRGYLIYRRRR